MHQSIVDRLGRLAPDQRAAATAPPGPVLCVAPAGSGKTTTLVARVAWLVDGGAIRRPRSASSRSTSGRPTSWSERLDAALEPLGVAAGSVRVRTFHALGREILGDAGVARRAAHRSRRDAARAVPAVDRRRRPRTARPRLLAAQARPPGRPRRSPRIRRRDPIAGAFVTYERAVAESGGARLRRPRGPRARALTSDEPASRCAGARARARCSSTRRRTSTGPSSSSRCSSPRPATTSSSSGTTTSRSTAGGWPTCVASWAWPPSSPACGGST